MRLRMLFLIIIMVFCFTMNASARKDSRMEYTKDRVSAKDFVIFPWGGMPELNKPGYFWGDTKSLDDTMLDLWECGFNTTGFLSAEKVKYAAKYGLSAVLSIGGLPANLTEAQQVELIKKALEKSKDSSSVLAIELRDEPSTGDFPFLAKWAKSVVTADSNLLPYINLLPNYASPGQLGAKDYDEYLERFVKECNPKFLSYDNYSLFEGSIINADRFYSNLEAMRAKALKYNLPFWNIVLGNCHFQYAEPTQATVSLQVFSSLAYGVRGISYFTYYTPIVGNYRLAPIDQFGHRTKTWDYIRFANLQIHKLAPTYLKLKSVNVFHHPNIPADCRGLADSKYLANVTGADLLVGEFEGPGNTPYVMVVNKSLLNSTWYGVEFKEKGNIMITSSYTGKEEKFAGENGWLAPGQGMLLHLKK